MYAGFLNEKKMEDTQDTLRKRLESMEETDLKVEALQNGIKTSQSVRVHVVLAVF